MTELLVGDEQMTEQTPGPWCFEAENGRAHPRVYGADNSLVAEVGNANLMRWEAWDHDARLIAAAPEMLAALQQMLTDPPATLDEPDPDHEVITKMREIARAAIAKAMEPRP